MRVLILSAAAALAATPARAAIVEVTVGGTFSTGFNGEPLDPLFPRPQLAGGSFLGTFTYDDAAAPTDSGDEIDSYDIIANTIELRTPADALDYTITLTTTAELRLIDLDGFKRLIIFLGSSITPEVDDLRLAFDVTGLGLAADGSPLTADELRLAVSGAFVPDPESLLDVEDEPRDRTLGVATGFARVPEVAVPAPAALALFGLGTALAAVARRRR